MPMQRSGVAESMHHINVLVVDESPGLTQGLLLSLPKRGHVRVLGPVSDLSAVTAAIADGLADVVVVALDRDDGRGLAIVAEIRDSHDGACILVATRLGGPEIAAGALAAGARGVLPTERDPHRLIDAFRRAYAGELVLPARDLPSLVDRLLDRRTTVRDDGALLGSLTGRETEILALLAQGLSTRDVASRLQISPLTVQSHVKNILGKLGVHTKVEAVRIAWREGLRAVTRTA
ncbi:MAG: response regulator transcription factor [Actinomycetota bacterium]